MATEELSILVRLKDLASKELGKLQSGIAGFGRGALGAFRGVTGAVFSLKGALAGLGVALTAKGIADLVKSTADEADELRDLSIQLGTTTEFLSELKFAAGQAGIELSTLEIGLKTLQKGLGEIAATGGGEAAEMLARLGPEIEQVVNSTASLEEKFLAVAKALKELPASERVFVASKLFGRGGGKILQFLEEDFDKASAAAKRFGLTLSASAAKDADAFNDAIGEMVRAFKGLRNQAILPLLPELQKFAEGITRFVVEEKPKILNFFADVVQGAGQAAQSIAKIIAGIKESFDEIGDLGIRKGLSEPELKRVAEVFKKVGIELKGVGETSRGVGDAIAESTAAAAEGIRALAKASKEAASPIEELEKQQAALRREFERLLEEDDVAKMFADMEKEVEKVNASIEKLGDQDFFSKDALEGARVAFEELTEASEEWGLATHDAILGVADVLTDNLTDAVVGLTDRTKDWGEKAHAVAEGILKDLLRIIAQTLILKAVQAGLGGLGTSIFGPSTSFAQGAAFDRGNVVPFAGGGIVAGPTAFPMSRGRTGLMGEAGPEAILPLRRGARGLGVEAVGGGGASQTIIVNVTSKNEDPKKDAEFIASVVAREMRTSASFRESMRAA